MNTWQKIQKSSNFTSRVSQVDDSQVRPFAPPEQKNENENQHPQQKTATKLNWSFGNIPVSRVQSTTGQAFYGDIQRVAAAQQENEKENELTKTNTDNPIRGILVPNAAQRENCQAVIASLTFDDIGRGSGTLHTSGVARLDMQGRTASGDANIQVQIEGGTVAAALIANSVLETTDPNNQRGISNAAISVLNQSMDSQTIWQLTGRLP